MSLLKLKNSLFKIFIELFIFDREKRSRIKARQAKKDLNKYADYAISFPFEKPNGQDEEIIWQYWHQGRENAPLLIQKCFESVQKYESDKKINVLSFETIKDYVELPQKYYELLKAKKIPIAIFSDILRLNLLKKYGGCWVDSTIYLTDKIPQEVWKSDFCLFQKDPVSDLQENKMSCYFIRAKKGSPNLQAIKRAIEKYWDENDFLINYFMFEHLSTILSDKTPELKAEWDKMPYLDGEISGQLQRTMFEDFNQDEWEKLISKCAIHKLTYKTLTNKTSGKSYYDWIVNLRASEVRI